MSTSNESIPIVLLGGYLGAGKTTLLNALLAAPGVPRTTVLVNDFGAINVDASLIQNSEGGVLSLANGCACCSMSDDLITTLLDVIDARASPELIVIELSGIAEPARVAGILSLVPGVTHVATSVLIDGARIGQLARDPQLAPLINAQLGAADDFVVTRSPSHGHLERADAIEWLAQRYPETPSTRSAIPGTLPRPWFEELVRVVRRERNRHTGASQSSENAAIVPHQVLNYPAAMPMDVEELSSLLADEKWHVERAKGFFFAADHGRSLRLLQHSGGTTQISMAPAGADKAGLVLLSAHPYFDEQALSVALDLLRRD